MFKFLGRILRFKPLEKEVSKVKQQLMKEQTSFSSLFGVIEHESLNKVNVHFINLDEKLSKAIFDIQQMLEKILTRLEMKDTKEINEVKWKFAALVMDRCFLILTTLYSIVTFCAIIMSVPNLYKPT